MSWTKVGLLVLLAVLLSTGQILFKSAAQSLKAEMAIDLASLSRLALNPFFVGGLVTHGTATVLWVTILRDTDLSRAYMIFALTLVLVPLAGIVIFKEALSYRQALGTAMVLFGLWIVLSE